MSRPQCYLCQHWQQRGGLIAAAQWQCTAIEGEAMPPRPAALLAGLLRLAADANQCPGFEAWPANPDAYRSADLPRD